MRLYIPTPRNNEAKMPHCKIYNPLMELTRSLPDDANCDSTPSGGMRGWSVLGSVPLMDSGVFGSLSAWLAG